MPGIAMPPHVFDRRTMTCQAVIETPNGALER